MVCGKGQYWPYYERIGKGKSKRYHCVFESCGSHIVKKLSSIYSHIERTHRPEINEIKRKKQEEEIQKRIAKEFETEFVIVEETPEEKRLREEKEGLKRKRDEEQRRKEKARKIEIENKAQKEIENERVRRGLIELLFLCEICKIKISDANLNFMMSELLNSFILE